MDILPAIDLKDGKAVRLTKGIMDSATIYNNEPWKVAKHFEELGAKWIHIVDLNGAFSGTPENLTQIQKIRESSNLKIQLGGGIRDENTIKMYLNLGVNRLILGSIALKDPDFVKKMAKKYPIAVGIDAIDGMVAIEGWAEVSSIKATDLAKEFANNGVESIICTDIGKDGMLCGANFQLTQEIANISKVATIVSGGVKDINDIIKCKQLGNISGIIVGKAYYEGTLNLSEAFELIK